VRGVGSVASGSDNCVFYGGGNLGAWLAVLATGWLQVHVLRVAARVDRAGPPKGTQLD